MLTKDELAGLDLLEGLVIETAKARALAGDPAGEDVCRAYGIRGALRFKLSGTGLLTDDTDTAAVPVRGKLTPGSICDFEAVITSGRKDRDGDILEPSGAILDPQCPLLWQHLPTMPIGRLVSKTVQ